MDYQKQIGSELMDLACGILNGSISVASAETSVTIAYSSQMMKEFKVNYVERNKPSEGDRVQGNLCR